MSAELPIRLAVACRHMRHKMMFCDDRHAHVGRVDVSEGHSHVFYCSKTQDSLGPDNEAVSVSECSPERGCYRDGA
jgi:hypothetical protein